MNTLAKLTAELASQTFEAQHGLYLEAGGIHLEAHPEHAADDKIDLRVTLRPGHIPAPPDDDAREADKELATRCLALLGATEKSGKGERMAAAQQLGTLRWTDAKGALENAALKDPDADVKIIATRALALLAADRVAAIDLANLQITAKTDLAGRFAGRTDASGRTRIAGIPALAECRLAVGEVGVQLRVLGLGDQPQIPLPKPGAAKAHAESVLGVLAAPAFGDGKPAEPVKYDPVAVEGAKLWIELAPTRDGGAELCFSTMEAKLEDREIRYQLGGDTGQVFLRKQTGFLIYEARGEVEGRFEDLRDQYPEIEVLPPGE